MSHALLGTLVLGILLDPDGDDDVKNFLMQAFVGATGFDTCSALRFLLLGRACDSEPTLASVASSAPVQSGVLGAMLPLGILRLPILSNMATEKTVVVKK
jgi:hypothetical protein